jgi:hypothetical protein
MLTIGVFRKKGEGVLSGSYAILSDEILERVS